MPVPANAYPARPRLVGRDAELAALRAAVSDCLDGRPRVILLTGEPGVGKTRLLGEVIAATEADLDVTVLAGFALEGGGTPPYFPVGRALRRALAQLVVREPSLRQLASVLGAAGLIDAGFDGFQPPASLAPDAERLRLFDAVADVCLRLAHHRPLLLALDDLHWADAGTWDMLTYVTRAASGGRIGMLVACRDEILSSGGVGQHALVELNRQRLLVHLPLARLAPEAVRALGQEFLGGQLADELAATLARRSEGNPFFAEEVLRGLQPQLRQDWSGAFYIPARERAAAEVTTSATLRLTIVRRLEALPGETLALMQAAAVLGRSFAVRTLARMCGQETDATERQLQPALAAGVLVRSAGDDTFMFVHDLLRETAYDLAAGERRRLHEAAARALSEGSGRDLERAATLAYHWRAAHIPLMAARASVEAAQAAQQVAAYAEALQHAAAACELFDQALAAGATAAELRQARLLLAEAALTCGNYTEAEAVYRLLLADAEQRGDRQEQGRLWARLGVLHHRRERPDEAGACLYRALEMLRGDPGSSRELVEVLIALTSLEGLTRAHYREATELGECARRIAGELGDARLQAEAALALAGVRIRAIDPPAGRPLLREALELALATDDPLLAADASGQLSNSYYWTGEMQQARAHAQRRLELAERANDAFGMRHAHSWLANVLLTLGEFDTAQALLDRCEPLLARLDSPEPIAVVRMFGAVIALHRGDFERSHTLAGEALAAFEQVDPATAIWYRGIIVLDCLALGRRAEAERHLHTVAATLATMPESALPARSARTVLGLAYVQLGDRQRAAECERALRPYAGDLHWWLARRTLAALAALRGDTALALADLVAAEGQARREGLLPDLTMLLLQRAELLGHTHPDRRAALLEARELARRLRMQAALARAAAMQAADQPTLDELTRRELDVLRQLARGKTNREIAEALSISEHTVVNHLSHIFGKIGVDNRTAAAAYALRHDIA